MEFQLSYIKSENMILLKFYTQPISKFGKCRTGHRAGKGPFSFQSQRRSRSKKCSNYHTVVLLSHASKAMPQILQAKLQQYVTENFQMYQLGLEKAEEPEIKLPALAGS